MQILVKRAPGTEFTAVQLYIRGGVRDWTATTAGLEHVALEVATGGGTKSLAKEAYTRRLASLGASIYGYAGNEFSTIAGKAPLGSWDELFPIVVETFLAPALPESEFELVKQRELSARRHEMEDGDGRLNLQVQRAVFAGHPYANRPVGTLESIGALKTTDVGPALAVLRDSNRLLLVIVGDVDAARVIDQAKAAFASVPRGPYVETPIPPLHFTAPRVSGDAFKLPTNYIESIFAGPQWGDPDFPAMRLGMNLLGDRMFDEVRTKRNLSYAPNAYLDSWRAAPYAVLYVTTVDPNTTMQVMFDQTRRLQTELIPAKELDGTKAVFLTNYVGQHETVDGQAAELAYSHLLGGDWHKAKAFADRVRATSPEDVRRVAATWLTIPQTTVVGDPSKLDPRIVDAAGLL